MVTWVKAKSHVGQGQRSTLKVKVKGQGHQVKNVIAGLMTMNYVLVITQP